MTMTLPFEQLPKESAKAFAAFTAYLNLGEDADPMPDYENVLTD